MKYWFKLLCLVFLAAFLVALWLSSHSVFVLGNVTIYNENGPLEFTQAVLLAIGCIVFLAPVVCQKRPEKLILIFCSLLCYSFLVRELDVERLNVPAALKFIGSGAGRKVSLALGFVTLLVLAGMRFSYHLKAGIAFLKSKPGILLMVGGVLLFVGDFFEKCHSINHNAFYEEIAELSGYIFILLSAFAANQYCRSPLALPGEPPA